MNTVEEYIQSFPEKTRHALTQIRETILKLVPEATEGISYAIPAYTLHGKPLVYFAGYAKHVGFYAIPTTHQQFAARLSAYKQGKGSVQFPLSQPMPLELIADILAFRVRELTDGT